MTIGLGIRVFSISGQWWPCVYLAWLWTYCMSNI